MLQILFSDLPKDHPSREYGFKIAIKIIFKDYFVERYFENVASAWTWVKTTAE